MEESPYSSPRSNEPFASPQERATDVDPADDPVAYVIDLHRRNYGDWTIVKKAAEYGIAAARVEEILAQLRAAEMGATRRSGWLRFLFGGAAFLLGSGATLYSVLRGEHVTFYWGLIVVGALIAVQGGMLLRTPHEPLD
jgi:hypothetical protein